MGKFHDTENSNRTKVEQPDIRVSVTNLGPIKSGSVDLRPLTIFVGPSNTGKTYFAILIYALRGILGGFPRLPVMFSYQHRFFGQGGGLDLSSTTADALVEELEGTLRELDRNGRLFKFSGLPKSVRDIAQAVLDDPDSLGAILGTELQRCFDLDSVSDLVRLAGSANMNVSTVASEKAARLWHFELEVSGAEITTRGHIEDMDLFPKGWPVRVSEFRQGLSEFRELIKERQGQDAVWNSQSYWISLKNSCASLPYTDAAKAIIFRPPAVASCRATALSPVLWWRGLLAEVWSAFRNFRRFRA